MDSFQLAEAPRWQTEDLVIVPFPVEPVGYDTANPDPDYANEVFLAAQTHHDAGEDVVVWANLRALPDAHLAAEAALSVAHLEGNISYAELAIELAKGDRALTIQAQNLIMFINRIHKRPNLKLVK